MTNVNTANTLLAYLINNSVSFPNGMAEVYPNLGEKVKAASIVQKKYDSLSHPDKLDQHAVRLYPHSTLLAIDSFSLSEGRTILPSEAKGLWTTLKEEKRIIQVGGGKGRAVVIVIAAPIPEENPATNLIDPTDPKALLKALQNQVVTAEADKEVYERLVKEKDERLKEMQKQNALLTAQAAAQTRTNWT